MAEPWNSGFKIFARWPGDSSHPATANGQDRQTPGCRQCFHRAFGSAAMPRARARSVMRKPSGVSCEKKPSRPMFSECIRAISQSSGSQARGIRPFSSRAALVNSNARFSISAAATGHDPESLPVELDTRRGLRFADASIGDETRMVAGATLGVCAKVSGMIALS